MKDCSKSLEKKMSEHDLRKDENPLTHEQDREITRDNALFVSEWKFKDGGMLFFPIQGREGEIVIDWGDGSSDVINSGNDAYISHQYRRRGIYTIKVDGTITQWSCNIHDNDKDNSMNSSKLIEILSYGKTSFGPYAFSCACNLVALPENESPRFFENRMVGVFYKASSFNQSIQHWDTSSITDMSRMFSCAESFNQPLNDWNTSNVTNMSGMFKRSWPCESSFNQPLDNWDTSNVTNMSEMFSGAERFNQPLGNWDISNVTNMSGIFSGAESFNQPLDNWNTSSVTDMSKMFERAKSFNQPLDKWNTSNVTDMSWMFSCASRFNQPLNDWNTSSVTDMSFMFEGARRFNQPLNYWDTSNVTNMSYMF